MSADAVPVKIKIMRPGAPSASWSSNGAHDIKQSTYQDQKGRRSNSTLTSRSRPAYRSRDGVHIARLLENLLTARRTLPFAGQVTIQIRDADDVTLGPRRLRCAGLGTYAEPVARIGERILKR